MDLSPELAKAIDKVRALRKLAGNNDQIEEVKAATAAADRIMSEYRISAAMLEAAGTVKSEPMVRKEAHSGGKRSSWVERILHGVCSKYGCAWYYNRTRERDWGGAEKRSANYIVIGRQSDTEIVSYMVEYLVGEGRRLARWNNKGFGVGWSKSYLEGFGIGVYEQFYALKKAAHAEVQAKVQTANALIAAVGGAIPANPVSAALVLLDKREIEAKTYMNQTCNFATYKRGPNKGKTKTSSCAGAWSDANAQREGVEAGRKVQINKGLPE